jgi:anti-anti-sigma factor
MVFSVFAYTCSEQGARTVVLCSGDLDVEATETIEEELIPKVSGGKEVELDFSDVPFVDSSGIGLLLSLITSVRANGNSIVVKNVSEDVQMVFSLLQLPEIVGHGVFEIS